MCQYTIMVFIFLAYFTSFFRELLVIALCSFPVAYWTPSNLKGYLLVSYLFAFVYCSWGSQGKNTGVVCHSLLQQTTFFFFFSEPFTMTCLSWVALHSMTQSFIELCKPLHHNKAMIHEREDLQRLGDLLIIARLIKLRETLF